MKHFRHFKYVSITVAALLFFLPALAQGDVLGYTELEVTEEQPFEGDTEFGQLLVRVATPTEFTLNVDVTVVGPDGVRFSGAVSDEQLIEGLPPGEYAIMGTDDDLEIVAGLTDVAAGLTKEVTLVMESYTYAQDFVFDYDAYEPFGGYDVGYSPVYGYGDYAGPFTDFGQLQVLIGFEVEPVGEAKVSIVGPDDTDFDVFGETYLDAIPPGMYSVAATYEGYEMQQALVWVRPGEIASVTIPLVSMTTAGAVAVEQVAILEPFGYDGDEITVADFQTGVYDLIAGDDDILDEDEFTEGFDLLYGGDYDYTFTDFDVNADAIVTEDEFVDAYGTDLFTVWDFDDDDALALGEFGTGLYGTIDIDDDNIVTVSEYGPYSDWFGYEYAEIAGDDELTEDEFLGIF